ncbi:MAG: hypothetical protein P1V36_07045 [Planctomycetota bacterium]|nr:hypothetical protein [Planctomycetota bacterium]
METRAAPKILVYDGDCRMCTQFSRVAEKRWLVGDAERRAADSFEGDEAVRLAEAGVHNELAVIEPASGEIRSGYDGILWLMRSGSLGWLTPLFARGPLAWLGRTDYRTVAYNRRILSPVSRSVTCACDPDLHRGYRWTFIVLCAAWMTFVMTVAAWMLLGGQPWLGGGLLLAWGIVALPAAAFPTPRNLDHLGHTAFIATLMTLPMLAAVIVRALVLITWAAGWAPDLVDGPQDGALLFAASAWGLALPLALWGCLRRLPLLQHSRATALAAALVLWTVPLAVVLLFGAASPG